MELQAIIATFQDLQLRMVAQLQQEDPQARSQSDTWQHSAGGGGRSFVFSEGQLLEKGGVNFSHVRGDALPTAATRQRPQLAGRPFTASGVSVVLHPASPLVPCTHFNVRVFHTAATATAPAVWWFGGGMDLTPYYPEIADVIAWHRAARAACDPFGKELYPRFKQACDQYFQLPHRQEARGVGGIFFDDFNELGEEDSFALVRAVSEAFLPAWLAIASRHRHRPFTPQQRAFQLYRRGRYVEFNLLYDRGTLFGLQSGGRTESILMSLPPAVHWHYGYQAPAGSPEAALVEYFLQPRDWLAEADTQGATAAQAMPVDSHAST